MLLQDFEKHINHRFLFLKENRIVLAFSGGIDSVVLAHLCHELKLDFALAHCNFGLRGLESDADEQFALDFAEQLNIEIFTQRFNTEAYAKQHKLSIQMSARELRYQWFHELAAQLKFDVILTAHHADDNLETFLINFTRGTGLNGLTGIPEYNDGIARPLLPFSRQQIETFALENDMVWREDSSNTSRKYLRNKLRHEVVPILKDVNPQLLDSFQNTLNHLNETAVIVNDRLEDFKAQALVSASDDIITYKVSEFRALNNPKAYLFELFKAYGFTEWNDVLHLLDAESGKYVRSGTHKLVKHREFLILTQLRSADHQTKHQGESAEASNNTITISESDVSSGQINTEIGTLSFEVISHAEDNTSHTIYVDTNQLNYPMQLRQWAQTDLFYPLGMQGKKTVSKYLKDEKLSPLEKEAVWVLTANDEVIWVVGMRADERFKITDTTSEILKIDVE